jgi:alkyl sulfatase BDS1-like metallo-beta-lactamase superfamily hydrolase
MVDSGIGGGKFMIESHSLSEHLFGVAESAVIRGDYKKALEFLEQVLIMNPRHVKARCEKEKCIQQLGRSKMHYAEILLPN